MKRLLVLLLIVCGFSTIGQAQQLRLQDKAQAQSESLVPTGFPVKIHITDEEHMTYTATNATGVRVEVFFDDGSTHLSNPLTAHGYSREEFNRNRDVFVNFLRSKGHNQSITKVTGTFRDGPGNIILATEEGDTYSEVPGVNLGFKVPYATNFVARGIYSDLLSLSSPGKSFATFRAPRELFGNSVGSITFFTSDNKTVTYSIVNGQVYPTLISIRLTFAEDDVNGNQPVPVIEVSGPPGEWFEVDQALSFTSSNAWKKIGGPMTVGSVPTAIEADTTANIGFFRARVVPPPNPEE